MIYDQFVNIYGYGAFGIHSLGEEELKSSEKHFSH